jgi:hypothetical protein
VLADVRLLDFVLGSEAMLELIAAPKISQLHLHHRSEISGRVMMELENLTKIPIESDDHASTEIVRLHEIRVSFR